VSIARFSARWTNPLYNKRLDIFQAVLSKVANALPEANARFSIEKGAFLQVNYSWGERSEQNMSE
jgi:hypothetical protein